MLNYLGPNIGPHGPMAAQLPPATPGTMPQAVPSAPPAAAPLPPPIHGASPPPSAALAAIMKHPAAAAAAASPLPEPPPLPEYGTTTQDDGSILLHLKNPDGSLGPVVKVIPPVKPRGTPQ